MRHRQAPHHGVLGPNAQRLVRRHHAVANGLVTQHHSLALVGGPGGKSNEGDVLPVGIRPLRPGQFCEKDPRPDRLAVCARLRADQRLQVQRRGDRRNFRLGAFPGYRHHHCARFPNCEREHDMRDSIGQADPDAGTRRHSQRRQSRGPFQNFLPQLGIRDRGLPVDQRRFQRPPARRVIQ